MSKTSDEAVEDIHRVIQSAVQRAGGDWKQAFYKEAAQIISLAGKAIGERDASA